MRGRRAIALICLLAMDSPRGVSAGNYSTGDKPAAKFGVHEVVLTGDGSVANPFDTLVTVRFVPQSGEKNAKAVQAFFDGDNLWRARVYVGEAGAWTWTSACPSDKRLDGQRGTFAARDSKLRGRLVPHPKNPRQWITEDGRWFLNLNDTAYFLLRSHDGNGDPISDEDVARYMRDDVERGITSIRCFLTGSKAGFVEAAQEWVNWFFVDDAYDRLRLDNLRCSDGRLRMLLDHHPDIAVQLILFPLGGYRRDDRFWTALKPAQRERLLRHLIARYAAFPQVFWLITNDAHYGPGFPNSNAMVREIGVWLQKHDLWQHPRSTGHARLLPFVFGSEEWATYIHIEHKHDLGALEYERYHAFGKPVFLGEDRYEQDHGTRLDPAHMRYWQRRLFWAWLLSGGSANYGGRWWTVHPYGKTGTCPATYRSRPGITFRTALTGLDSVKVIRDYFERRRIDLGEFEPAHALAGADRSPRAPRVMRRGQEDFLVYHPNAADDAQEARPDPQATARLRLDLRAAKASFTVEWYRVEDGAVCDGGTVEGGKPVDVRSPWTGHDVVLRLRRLQNAAQDRNLTTLEGSAVNTDKNR